MYFASGGTAVCQDDAVGHSGRLAIRSQGVSHQDQKHAKVQSDERKTSDWGLIEKSSKGFLQVSNFKLQAHRCAVRPFQSNVYAVSMLASMRLGQPDRNKARGTANEDMGRESESGFGIETGPQSRFRKSEE